MQSPLSFASYVWVEKDRREELCRLPALSVLCELMQFQQDSVTAGVICI